MTALRLGMLTPSSNTVLEPATAAMLRDTPEITAHFARFRVTAINLGDGALAQFDHAPILAAAELLADAKVHAICGSGPPGGGRGLGAARALWDATTGRPGTPATTATLALADALRILGTQRLGLVTPYLADVQRAIAATFGREGFPVAAERHLADPGNFSFAAHTPETVAAMIRAVAAEGADAAAVFCTNFRGAAVVAALEAEAGIPVLDSVALALWGAIRTAVGDPSRSRGWGRLFGI